MTGLDDAAKALSINRSAVYSSGATRPESRSGADGTPAQLCGRRRGDDPAPIRGLQPPNLLSGPG